MWGHGLPSLCCPRCGGDLELRAVEDGEWIESGSLLCPPCRSLYPIHRGVPILLVYPTAMAETEIASWPAAMREELQGGGYKLPTDAAPKGEAFVQASFSTEWNDYNYGDTLWTAPTEDRVQTFRGECGLSDGDLRGKRFCEIGCGLGIMTHAAATGLGAEAWGVDLSQAVFRAAAHFREVRTLHFVQASVFQLPLRRHSFDFLYSHGVLHHTWSTKEAIRHAVELLHDHGSFYVWLYGFADVRISLMRRIAYGLEAVTRPIIARLPGPLATVALWPTIPFYQWASVEGQKSGTHGARYTTQQALHAARDRFTPLYAHRHEDAEVRQWLLAEFGFDEVERVGGDEVTGAWSLAIERNVALRGHRKRGATVS